MKRTFFITLLFTMILFTGFKEDKKAFQLFDQKGKQVAYNELLKAAAEADIVLFGELHNNPICHWLQLELTNDLFAQKKNKLVLGAEMFEADDQLTINEYLKGLVSEKTFKDEAKLWNNYATDYKPLLDFAKINQLRFIATNIPRRYANLVYSKGMEKLDSLDAEARRFITPLPMAYDPELKGYKDMLAMGNGHGGDNLPKSQAIKDATMAHFILKNMEKGQTFLHFHGTYHSNNFEGIYWYLKQANKDLKIVTISSVEQDDLSSLADENKSLGTFTIAVQARMTKTY